MERRTADQQRSERDGLIESYGIEPIRDEDRHGAPRNQFTLWFGANSHLAAAFIGSIGVTMGLDLVSSMIAIVLANILGSSLLGLCSMMGPRLGAPQMVVGRSVFGFKGNRVPAILNWLNGMGWFAINCVLAAEALAQLFSVPYYLSAMIIPMVIVGVAIVGHDFIHQFQKYFTWLAIVVMGTVIVLSFVRGLGPLSHATIEAGTTKYWASLSIVFAGALSLAFSWIPFGSDYARYLPKTTRLHSVWLYSWLGSSLSLTFMTFLGALLATYNNSRGIVPAFSTAAGGFAWAAYLVTIIGSLTANSLNAYSSALSGLVFNIPLSRRGSIILIGAIGLAVALLFDGDKLTTFVEPFLLMLIYWIGPWAGVILVDRWLISRGRSLDISVLYSPEKTGSFRSRGLLSFLAGVLASVPFIYSDIFTGPVGKLFGFDISYVIGLAVSAVLYWTWSRRTSMA